MNDPASALWYGADSALGVLFALALGLSPWLARWLRGGRWAALPTIWAGGLGAWWVLAMGFTVWRTAVSGPGHPTQTCFDPDWFDHQGPVTCFNATLPQLQLATTSMLLVDHALLLAAILRRGRRRLPGALWAIAATALGTAAWVGWVYRAEELLLPEWAYRWPWGLLGAGLTRWALGALIFAVPAMAAQAAMGWVRRRGLTRRALDRSAR